MDASHEPSDEPAPEEPAPAELSLDALSRAYAEAMGPPHGEEGGLSETSEEEEAVEEEDDEYEDEEVDEEEESETPVTPRGILEAVLFVGHPQNEPLTARQIASLMRGVSAKEVDQMVIEINEELAEDDTPYYIASVGGGYCMTLRDAYASLRDMFYGKQREAKLSQSAVDVLAIVAYHQPVDRNQVDTLRGRSSSRILSQLVRRKLLCIDRPDGRPRQPFYQTTERFLHLFGLEGLDSLPRSEMIDSA